MASNDVNVRFGGDTRELDAASARARSDINSIRPPVTALQSTLSNFQQSVGRAFNSPQVGAMRQQISGMAGEINLASIATTGLASAVGGLAAGVGIAFSLSAVMNFAEGMGALAEQLDQTAQKLGMAATDVSRWGAVAEMAGKSTQSWAAAMTRLERAQVAAANGGRQQAATFQALGIEASKVTDQNELMLQIADRFSKMEDGPRKVALAMALMGRAGAEMIPIFNQGSDAIREQMALAESYGAVMSDDLVAAGLRVDDAFDEMNLAMQGLRNTLFEALAPAIQAVVEGLNAMIKSMVDSYRQGGAMKLVLDSLVLSLRVVIATVDALVTGFVQLWSVGQAAIMSLMGPLMVLGRLIYDVFSGNFQAAVRNFQAGMGAVGNTIRAEIAKIDAAGKGFAERQKKLWGAASPAPPRTRPRGGGDLEIEGFGAGGSSAASKAQREADARMRAKLEEIEFNKDMARDDFETQMRLEDEKLTTLKERYGAQSAEYQRALREKARMQRDHNQEILQLERQKVQVQSQIDRTGLEAKRAQSLADIEIERQRIEFQAQNGRINEQQKVAALAALKQREYQLEVNAANQVYQVQVEALRAELALQNLRPQERQRVLDQIAIMEAQHAQRMAEMAARNRSEMTKTAIDGAQATINSWTKVTQPIGQAFSQMFTQIYNRQATFTDALLQAIDSIVLHFAQKGIEMLANWVATQLGMTTATAVSQTTQTAVVTAGEAARTGVVAAGSAARVGIEAGAAATSKGITIATALSEIGARAASAAAGAYSAIAAIPVVGPFLAPAMAAAALVGVLALGSKIASAAGGWERVPADGTVTELHKDEMVLPAKFANPLRGIISDWQPQQQPGRGTREGWALGQSMSQSSVGVSRGDTNFYYQPKTELRNVSMDEMLSRDGATLRRWFHNEVRNGALNLP